MKKIDIIILSNTVEEKFPEKFINCDVLGWGAETDHLYSLHGHHRNRF
jgi:hypothetical protein